MRMHENAQSKLGFIGMIGIWSVSTKFLLLPISCTDFNTVGVSQKSSKIAQKMLVNTEIKSKMWLSVYFMFINV